MRKTPAPRGNPQGRAAEVAALLAAARAVVENRTFADAAEVVLGACKTAVGAQAGFVILATAGGESRETVLCDPRDLGLDSAAGLSAPLRRLLDRAFKVGRTVFANHLATAAAATSPAGYPLVLENVLLAPITIATDVVGLVGLLGKPGVFSAADSRLVEVFAEIAAVAIQRSRTVDLSERRAQSIAEALRESTLVLTRSLDRETVLVTMLEHLRRLVPYDRASVMLMEEASRLSIRAIFDGDRVVPLAAAARPELSVTDHPIVQGILATGGAVLIPDVRKRPDWSLPTDRTSEVSWMGIPLFARGNVAGLFSLSKREPGYFNEEHVRLAEAMSSQASVAVENAVLFEQMQASAVRMQSLSRRLVETQESERRNIARELHDEAGQALASLRYGLRLLEREVAQGGGVTERVAELVQRTDAVIDSLHRLAADLRPASLDLLGLEAALRQYSRAAGAKFGVAVRFKARGFTDERLPTVVETALYRVVQEAMANVVRHAQATRVDVLVERRGGRVMVMVEDDGVGFEPAKVQHGNHLGLLGIRERAEALGGTLTVESAPGAGTTVVVEVPDVDPHPDR